MPQSDPPNSPPATTPTLAILICTFDRPDILRRCLASIAAGTEQPNDILVSDDGHDGEVRTVCAAFPGVRYMVGPRRGLCANRNAAIRQARSDFVSLLDDDAVVARDFVARARAAIADLPPRTLLTGTVIETDHPVVAGNPTFLGFFGKPPQGRYRSINLNCNVFPRAAFAEAAFDETIFYGYEDMDLCGHLVSRGYSIRFVPDLTNTHLPPARAATTDQRRHALSERARFYTSVKRHLLWDRNVPAFLAYMVAAPTHRALHAIKTGKWFDLVAAVTDIGFALRATWRERGRLARQYG
jgi:GT2 family glycosyltransferase